MLGRGAKGLYTSTVTCRESWSRTASLEEEEDIYLAQTVMTVMHKLLPDKTDHFYDLRPRRHSYSLTVKTDCCNFINRLLSKTFISLSSHFHFMVAFKHVY